MSALLYERRWKLELIPPVTSIVQTSAYAVVFSSGTYDTPLRFTFECERSLMSEPNKGKFVLTNLANSTASLIQPGTLVVLSAGYVSNAALIYKGQVAKVETSRQGPDTQTTIETGDGEPYIALSHVQLSYKGKITLTQVLQDIAQKMRVTVGGQVYQRKGIIAQGVPYKQYRNLTLAGLLRDVLDTLLHPLGMSWSIQSGVLLIQNSKGILSLRSVVLTEQSGLVEQVSKTDMGMSAKTLMIPYITPGNAVTIAGSGRTLDGNYRVVKTTYRGDTMGQEWGIDIDAQTLVNPLAPAPTAKKDTDLAAATDMAANADSNSIDEAAQ